jgi:hypothetical protein
MQAAYQVSLTHRQQPSHVQVMLIDAALHAVEIISAHQPPTCKLRAPEHLVLDHLTHGADSALANECKLPLASNSNEDSRPCPEIES